MVCCFRLRWPFCTWSVTFGLASPLKLGDAPQYTEFLYQLSKPFAYAKHDILAMQNRFRHTKHNLRSAWDALGTWEIHLPLNMRTPLPVHVLWGVFAASMLLGFILDREFAADWLSFGIAVLSMFWGMLRPGEYFNLVSSNVLLPRKLTRQARALLSVHRPKNQRSMGKHQVAILEHAVCVRDLFWMLSGLPAGQKLFVGGRPKFRRMFAHGFSVSKQQQLW